MNRFLLVLLFLGIVNVVYAQKKVTGYVTSDEDNLPVIGATIGVKDHPGIGTFTDADGNFTLSVPTDAKEIVVSYVGMETQNVVIKPSMTIILKSISRTLGEVVVTGMTSMDKRLFTGATNRLDAADVKLDGMSEISRSLEGRSAGVSVQNVSGTFGTAPKIRVRGATSIYGDSKPLWVVDGVILEDVTEVSADALSSGDATTLISSAIAGLNSDDIESFQILKDGSATSIYGARAMAGVIVVTTKKGRPGITSINYTGEFTMRMKPSYRDFNIMNSQEQMNVYKEMQQKGWLNFSSLMRANSSGVYGRMYQMMTQYDETNGMFGLANTPEARNAYLREAEFRNTDWFDELFNTNVMQNHAVSVSSGTEKTQFYGSISAMLDPGWTPQSKVNRYTANMNITHKILPNLSINMISNTSYRKQKAPGTLSQDVDPVYGLVKRDFDINPYSYAMNTSRALSIDEFYTRQYAPFNILHELENNNMEINNIDMRNQISLDWNVIPELKLSVLGAIKYINATTEHYVKDNSNQAQAYRAMGDATIQDNNQLLYKDPDNPYDLPISVLPEGGIYYKKDNRMYGYDFRTSFNFNKEFDNTHLVNVYGGMEVNSVERKQTNFTGWGLQYDMGETPFYIYQFFKKGTEANTDYYDITNSRRRSVAFFGMANYSYKGKYVVNGTFRYEGTNRMGKARSARWLPTWNIAGSWNAHEESFFKDWESVISNLTIRTSYSLTGDAGPAFVTNSRVVVAPTIPYRPIAGDKETGLYVAGLENSELTYEKKHEFNIGTNVGFLKNRINVEVDWFTRNNYDLIGQINTQGIGGQITKYANVAEMKSHGIEFTLSTRNIVTKDFTWSTDFIFSNIKTEVTKLLTNSRVIDFVYGDAGAGFTREGYPHRGIYSIPFAGLSDEGLPQLYGPDGEIQAYNNINLQLRDPELTKYLIYEGPSEPTTTGSLGNIFTYKRFRLNVFATYSFGNVIRLDPVFGAVYNDLDAMPKDFRNRWVLPGDENYTSIPVLASYRQFRETSMIERGYNAYNYSSARIAKGDFIRLKEVSLSYDFPKQWLGKSIKNLSLKVQATNLFLIYADKKLNGQDPEFFRSGGVSAPVPRQFTMTVRLGL